MYLGEVLENVEAALRDGDIHGVFGADVNDSARFRKEYEVISMNGAFVMDWIVFHLQEQKQHH